MKRFRRWLFNFAAAVSLMACVAFVPIWVVSQRRQGVLDIQFPDRADANPYRLDLIVLGSAEGGIRIHHQQITMTNPSEIAAAVPVVGTAIRIQFGTVSNPPIYTGFSQLKFGWIPRFVNASDPGSTQTKEELRIRDWFFMMMTAILPGIWMIRHCATRRRMAVGLCIKCGYDLRATPGRCPECGAVPSAENSASLNS